MTDVIYAHIIIYDFIADFKTSVWLVLTHILIPSEACHEVTQIISTLT